MAVDRRVLIAIILVVVAGLAFFASGSLNVIDPGDSCEWQDVEIEGQQFDSLEDFRDAAETQGVNFDDTFGDVAFRERDGTLQFRPDQCGVKEVPTDQ
ncbi:hypothetical protein [Natrinema salinisoli]|uniref:hypothetical protein n=1 Tax=Natrinema salinisoli TaxID=2878535 RepID=UPI001CF04DFA|nr:hypothetical protein [Natrinema salinisoli]